MALKRPRFGKHRSNFPPGYDQSVQLHVAEVDRDGRSDPGASPRASRRCPSPPGSMVRWTLPARPAGHSLPVPAGRSLAVRAAPPSSPFCREESGRRPQKRLPASTTNNGKEDGRRCGTSSLERQCGLGELSRSSALRRSLRRSWQDGAVRPRGSPGDPLVWVPSSAVGGRAPSRPSPGLRPARGLSGDGRRTAAALSFRGQRQDAASSTATGRGRLQHRAEGTEQQSGRRPPPRPSPSASSSGSLPSLKTLPVPALRTPAPHVSTRSQTVLRAHRSRLHRPPPPRLGRCLPTAVRMWLSPAGRDLPAI